jgi:hypothetical protein
VFAGCPESEEGQTPGDCSDGADNDVDGAYDCNDSGCIAAPECLANDDDDSSGSGSDDDDSLLVDDCRPIDEAWIPGTPLRLPCEPTFEPCDNIDNDNDGITDPHCPTIPCTEDGVNWSTGACQFGGLLLDADCNVWNLPEPGCNQIDGAPFDLPTSDCQGMLCPPGRKCFAGNCIEGGNLPPEAPCTSGAECPINAGCIPEIFGDLSSAKCVYFCAYSPCPDGYICIDDNPVTTPSGITVNLLTCH